jgi:rod shape-determining protein MreD
MNNTFLNNVLRFIVLFLLQIFLFDQINFMGYINPMIYILFLILYPVENKPAYFMLVAFAMGIILDTFQDTGGAHAAACVTLAFTRPLWLRLVYGEGYLMKNLKILQSPLDRILLFLVLCINIHHLVFFNLVIFNTTQILYTLKLTFAVGLASLLLNSIFLILFKPRSRS